MTGHSVQHHDIGAGRRRPGPLSIAGGDLDARLEPCSSLPRLTCCVKARTSRARGLTANP